MSRWKIALFSVGVFFALSFVFAVLIGNATEAPQPTGAKERGKTITDVSSFLHSLRAAGVGGERVGEVEQPFFTVKGTMIKVRDEDVQVYQYSDAKAADAESGRISRDGTTVGKTKIHWIGTPHFYKQGRIVVLYLGDNRDVFKTLETLLGMPFAGK